MPLFDDNTYQWRETYFVLFEQVHRPQTSDVLEAFHKLDTPYEIKNAKTNDEGQLESLTLISPEDYAAMDINGIFGEEVTDHAVELATQLYEMADDEEKQLLGRFTECDARFDVYHFEQVTAALGSDEPDEMLDPGSLLIVLDQLAKLCQGIGVDPQSGTLMAD